MLFDPVQNDLLKDSYELEKNKYQNMITDARNNLEKKNK